MNCLEAISLRIRQTARTRGVPQTLPRCFVALLLILIAIPVFAQFEGVIESKNLTTDEIGVLKQFDMTMWIRKDMARIQTSEAGLPGQTMIYRHDLRTVWVVQYEDKTYFEIAQEDQQVNPAPDGMGSDKHSIRKTGKTKKILGYPCEQVLIIRADEKTEIYGTKKLAHLSKAISLALGEDGANAKNGWPNELATMGIFPLLSSTRIGKKIVESQEVTRIDARKIDASLFEIPPGFEKQDMKKIMEGPPVDEK